MADLYYQTEGWMENSLGKLPLSISVETQCGLLVKIADIGTPLPIKTAKVFSTGIDIPETVGIRLYAGERPFAEDNLLITELKLSGIKELPSWRPIISLVVEIDMNCNIDIEVTDEGSLKRAGQQLDNSWVPMPDQILNMVREAQANQESDSSYQNRVRWMQMSKEALCRSELKFKAVKRKLSFEKNLQYKQKLRKIKAMLKKINVEDMTELLYNTAAASINDLDNMIGISEAPV